MAAKKQTSDRISSLAAQGMANWKQNLRTLKERKTAAHIARIRRRRVPNLGLTFDQVLSILASCESQDEIKGLANVKKTAAQMGKR